MDNKNLFSLAEVIGVSIPEGVDGNTTYQRVLTQSVYVQPGDVVISAKWYHEETTIREALEKGAVAVFCSAEKKAIFSDEKVIPVQDPLECVLRYEEWCVRSCTAKRIAITGSVGKTTTTGLINTVIANSFNTLTHHSMSNSHGAVLRNAQILEPSHEYWVQEVGGVQPGYVESTAAFLKPDIVVLTNVGESHLNLYGTKENILKDKGSLEKYAKADGVVIISYDDELLRNTKFSHKTITCSKSNPNADYYAEDIHIELDGTYFTAVTKDGRYTVHLNLYGEHNVYNALFAIAVGQLAELPMERIVELLEQYYPDGMRQNLVKVGGYTIFLDAFNAEPKTVLGAAVTLTQMPKPVGGRKIFVTGHIDKLGVESPQMHTDLGHELAKLELDLIVLFAGDSKYTYQAIIENGNTNAILMTSRDDLDNWLRENLTHEDIVFFKSGQFEAGLAKTVDHVFGTVFQNGQQFNNGTVVQSKGYKIRIRQDKIAEIIGYTGTDVNLVLPEKYEENIVRRIAPLAFAKNRTIESVDIPDTVEHIGKEAFYICPKLNRVKLPAKLRFIDNNAFNYCREIEFLKIPDGTIHIGRHAFYDCNKLRNVVVPNTVGFLGEDVFGSDDSSRKLPMKIVCSTGSYAERYAADNNIPVTHICAEMAEAENRLIVHARVIEKIQKLVGLLSRQTHLNDIDAIWDKAESSAGQIAALQEQDESIKNIVIKNKEIADKNISELLKSDEKLNTLIQSNNDAITQSIADLEKKNAAQDEFIQSNKDAVAQAIAVLEKKNTAQDELIQSNKDAVAHAMVAMEEQNMALSDLVHMNKESVDQKVTDLQEQDAATLKLIEDNTLLTEKALADADEKINLMMQKMNKKMLYAYLIAGGALTLAIVEMLLILLR